MVWKCKKCGMSGNDDLVPKEHGYIRIVNGHIRRIVCDGEIVEEKI